MSNVKLGIVGLGRLGRKHAENIHYSIPNAKLSAICSVVEEELESVASEMNPGHVTGDFKELLSISDLDGIVIASSSREHGRMVVEAAEAGVKYVFVEKPIGMTLEEISRIRTAIAANRNMNVQVGYNRRFDRSVRAAKRKIDDGFVGTPIQIRMINRDPAGMAEFIIKFSPGSGGLVMDMLTHDYDCARWFVGSEAKSIYGVGDAFVYEGLKEVGDIDNCNILVEFENGVIGQFETSRNCSYGYHVETEVYGPDGAIRIGTVPEKDRVTWMSAAGVVKECAEWFFEYWEPTFEAEIRHFVDCIRNGSDPDVGLEDGCRAVEWACAATEAVRERKVVRM